MRSTATVLFFKLCLLSAFTNIASASSGYNGIDKRGTSALKMPMFSASSFIERETYNPVLAPELSKMHKEETQNSIDGKTFKMPVFDARCFESEPKIYKKIETKDSFAQTVNFSNSKETIEKNKRPNTFLSYSLAYKNSVLGELSSIKSRSKNLLEKIQSYNKKAKSKDCPNKLIEKINLMPEETQEQITEKKIFIENSITETRDYFERLKNEAIEKLQMMDSELNEKVGIKQRIVTEQIQPSLQKPWPSTTGSLFTQTHNKVEIKNEEPVQSFIEEEFLYTNPNYKKEILEEIERVRSNLKHVVTNEHLFNNSNKKDANKSALNSNLNQPRVGWSGLFGFKPSPKTTNNKRNF